MNLTNKILTLDDLYNFYSTKKKSMTFSAEKTGYNLSVQVNGKFEVQTDENSEGLLYAKVRAFHDLGNRNKSYIETDILEQYLPSMKDRPIMADIIEIEDKDGNIVKDFNGHTMTLSEDGEKIIYIEKPVGHFVNPEDFHLEWSDEYQRNFVIADCVIYEEYTDTCDILRRRGTTDCSVELCIRDMSYDCKTKELHINSFYVQGCTLLGAHVQPGMAGSRLQLKDFSEENNSVFSNLSETEEIKEKLIEMQESIDEMLTRFNIKDSEESTDTYEKEDVIKVEEKDILVNEEVTETEETEETEVKTETEEVEENEVKFELIEKSFEVDGRKFSVSFELSHEDIKYGLYGLLETYMELDNDFYDVRCVYDDYFVFQGWFTGKIYGQKYTKDGNTVAFDGERYELFEELLTATEKAELESMRSNYSSLAQFKEDTEKAQLHAQREEILYNEKYSVLAEKDENNEYKNEAYAKLVSEMDNYSLVDLEKELKSVFADYITNGGQFAYAGEPEVKTVSKKLFATSTSKKSSRYGNLFSKKETE